MSCAPHADIPRLSADPDLRVHSVHIEALAAEIFVLLGRLMNDGNALIVMDEIRSGRYVQVITNDGEHLYAESVGNEFLDGPNQLDEAECEALRHLGWHEPLPDEIGNWLADWESVGAPELMEASVLLALTLIDVHGLCSADGLSIMASDTQSAVA